MNDPYGGTPKYQEVYSIYEGLQAMASGEEIGIISDIYPDVSWDGQDYYYTDEGGKLLETFEGLSECGNDFLKLDIANDFVLSGDENYDLPKSINPCLFMEEFLNCPTSGIAKEIKFKAVFLKNIECVGKSDFNRICEELYEEIHERGIDDFYNLSRIFTIVLEDNGLFNLTGVFVNLNGFVNDLRKNLDKLNLDREKEIILKSRAMLTAYDDFIFGLKANQALYENLESMYHNRVSALERKCEMLTEIIRQNGIEIDFETQKLLTDISVT